MKRARTLLPRLLGAAGLTAALVAAITAFSGSGFSATAAQSEYAPTNTTPPSISGTPTVGNVLTANPGTWTSTTQPTYKYQWERCNTTGQACSDLAGQTNQTYTVQQADVGSTIRVRVTASNSGGSTDATSPQTSLVQAAATTTTTTTTPTTTTVGKTVLASNVSLPDRLIVDRVRSARIASHRPFVVRFHVSNLKGQSVQGALVYALGLPYSWARNAPEVPTDATGWATIVMRPTSNLPLRRGGALVIFVRARVAGQNLLAGASTRRLVQVTVR